MKKEFILFDDLSGTNGTNVTKLIQLVCYIFYLAFLVTIFLTLKIQLLPSIIGGLVGGLIGFNFVVVVLLDNLYSNEFYYNMRFYNIKYHHIMFYYLHLMYRAKVIVVIIVMTIIAFVLSGYEWLVFVAMIYYLLIGIPFNISIMLIASLPKKDVGAQFLKTVYCFLMIGFFFIAIIVIFGNILYQSIFTVIVLILTILNYSMFQFILRRSDV